MSAQDNIRLIERYTTELFQKGNVDAADELLAEDYTHHTPPMGMEGTREGFKDFVRMVHSGLSELTTRTDEIFTAGDDKVVQRWTGTGTHDGELFGVPASGNRVEFDGISIYRLKDGKITDDWTRSDMVGLMSQIGAMPQLQDA